MYSYTLKGIIYLMGFHIAQDSCDRKCRNIFEIFNLNAKKGRENYDKSMTYHLLCMHLHRQRWLPHQLAKCQIHKKVNAEKFLEICTFSVENLVSVCGEPYYFQSYEHFCWFCNCIPWHRKAQKLETGKIKNEEMKFV